jgi:hypothetical protein
LNRNIDEIHQNSSVQKKKGKQRLFRDAQRLSLCMEMAFNGKNFESQVMMVGRASILSFLWCTEARP